MVKSDSLTIVVRLSTSLSRSCPRPVVRATAIIPGSTIAPVSSSVLGGDASIAKPASSAINFPLTKSLIWSRSPSSPSPSSLDEFEVRYKLPLQDVFGAEIIDVRIKRADFPDAIQSSVFARMQAERERIASGLRAEGAQRDAEIRANVDRQVTVLIETAQGTSARLRGEAESEAIAVLAESLNKDPELYAFKRYLETYAKSLDEKDTIVLSSDSPLFKYLKDQSVIEDLD